MQTKTIYKLTYFFLFLFFLLVGLTLAFKVSGSRIGMANGSYRWIPLGPVNLQPMEFFKITIALYLAYFYSSKQSTIKSFARGTLPPAIVCVLASTMLAIQPDFGSCAIVFTLFMFMWFVCGGNYLHWGASIGIGGLLGYLAISLSPYRLKRMTSFINPFEDARGNGYQAVQSLLAFGSGGVWGVGLGASKQKASYLPEGHTDFILAIVGEELGFVGVSTVILLFLLLFWRCVKLIYSLDNMRDRYTAMALTFILAVGFLANLGVVISCLPCKGVAMPFLSYGGSSLLASMVIVGILLNLSKNRRA